MSKAKPNTIKISKKTVNMRYWQSLPWNNFYTSTGAVPSAMGFSLRQISPPAKFCQHLHLEILAQVIPDQYFERALQTINLAHTRQRKLNPKLTLQFMIASQLFAPLSLAEAFANVAQGLRYIWPDDTLPLPTASALNYRRYQLGPGPLVALFKLLCKPLATPATPGAFLFGLRVMALDGTVEQACDFGANATAFGRLGSDRGQSAFPQLQGVYLVECGTHAICDAGFWPARTSERLGGHRLLRSVGPGMLLTWDRGESSYEMVNQATLERKAQVLGRLPKSVQPQFIQSLSDGSYLAWLHPTERAAKRRGERLKVRIIEYTLNDPALPGHGELHRLVTSLLDPTLYPAQTLAVAYHERWEVELTIDETYTHQRGAVGPLRSRKPVGVLQELYALLIAHYVVRALMHQSAHSLRLDVDRLSFVHALQVVRRATIEFEQTAPVELPRLYQRLLADIGALRLPTRRLRSNPRVVKKKMSNFALKRAEHTKSLQPKVKTFEQAVVIQPSLPSPCAHSPDVAA